MDTLSQVPQAYAANSFTYQEAILFRNIFAFVASKAMTWFGNTDSRSLSVHRCILDHLLAKLQKTTKVVSRDNTKRYSMTCESIRVPDLITATTLKTPSGKKPSGQNMLRQNTNRDIAQRAKNPGGKTCRLHLI
ncbi:MAG: hypothetical protein ACK5ME_00380 [Parahaliea sp.]